MRTACIRRGVVTALLLMTALTVKAKDADNVVGLGTQQTTGSDMGQGLLIREQVRQAILIAARDEMGLITRDAALREFDLASWSPTTGRPTVTRPPGTRSGRPAAPTSWACSPESTWPTTAPPTPHAWAALVEMGLDPRTLREPIKDK